MSYCREHSFAYLKKKILKQNYEFKDFVHFYGFWFYRKNVPVYILFEVLRMSNSSSLIFIVKFSILLPIDRDSKSNMMTKLFCFSGDDFSLIQQEIFMVKECKHCNIVAYFGSYLR